MRLWDKHIPRATTEEKIFTNFDKLRSCKKRALWGSSLKKEKSHNLFYIDKKDI